MKHYTSMRNMLGALTFALLYLFSVAAVPVTVSRYEITQPSGEAVLTLDAAEAWGGVVLQAFATYVGSDNERLDITTIMLDRFDKPNASLYLTHNGKSHFYRINESELARIMSWINNHGTGLYTAYSRSDKEAKDAGISPFEGGGFVATEFANTSLATLANYLDYPENMFVQRPTNATDIATRHNAGLSAQDRTIDRNWVVSDLDSHFTVSLANSAITITGAPLRYFRDEVRDSQRVFVTDVEEFIDEPLSTLKTRLLKSYGEDADLADADTHLRAVRFTQSVAMLRAIYVGNRQTWNKFCESFFQVETVQ